jgi:pilus assembly protein Flp/PilA
MRAELKRFWTDESGATAIEYGLIACLISIVCVAIWKSVGGSLNTAFTSVKNGLAQ